MLKKLKAKILAGLTMAACAVTAVGVCAQADFSMPTKANAEQASASVTLTVESNNLSYSDNIYVLYAVSVEGTAINASDVKMLFWDEVQTEYTMATVSEYDTINNRTYIQENRGTKTINDKDCLIFYSYGLAAKEFTDDIYCRAYVNVDGVEYYSEVEKYSVLQYTYEKSQDAGVKQSLLNMFDAMLDYGAAAQVLFDYKTATPANGDYVYVDVANAILPDGFGYGMYAPGTTLTITPVEGYEFNAGKSAYTVEEGVVTLTVPTMDFKDNTSFAVITDEPKCNHVYDNACDVDCNECGEIREVEGHVYDNVCDADCNECGDVREVEGHVYDNDVDVDCNNCGTQKVVINLSNRQDVDLDLTYNNGLVLSGDNAILALEGVGAIDSISSISINGEALEGASYADGTISIAKSVFGTKFGEATLVINAVRDDGAALLIKAPVLLITKAISNAAELDMWYTLADELDYNESTGKSYAFVSDGYFVLDQNVVYNKSYNAWPSWDATGGKWRDAAKNGFKGTLDGRGYCIEGLTIATNYSAFVTLLHTDGVIKNIGFTQASLSAIASGFVCVWGGGTIENVYVQYAAGAWGVAGGYNGTFFATDTVRGVTENNGLTIKDCFIDATAITESAVTNSKRGWMGYCADATVNYVDLQGVYAWTPTTISMNYVREYLGENEVHGAFATAAEVAKKAAIQAELATWDTNYWTIVNGVPTWNKSI